MGLNRYQSRAGLIEGLTEEQPAPRQAERDQAVPDDVAWKRPEPDLHLFRDDPDSEWIAYRPELRVRLRNGRSNPDQPDPSLFAIEQISEQTHFLCELRGPRDELETFARALTPTITGGRWLRIGRGGAAVTVIDHGWVGDPSGPGQTEHEASCEGWCDSHFDIGPARPRRRPLLDHQSATSSRAALAGSGRACACHAAVFKRLTTIRGFNGTSRLWRGPVAGPPPRGRCSESRARTFQSCRLD